MEPKLLHAVIDAGSSGTRLFLYGVEKGAYPLVELLAQFENPIMPNGEKEDGINNLVSADGAGAMKDVVPLIISPLLDKIRPLIARHNLHPHDVVVDLLGTAGMRYADNMFGSQLISEFYEHIRRGIVEAGFKAGEVRTSDGQCEEGVWTWINLNDLERDIFRTKTIPLGVVEVGGSSAQITYPSLGVDQSKAGIPNGGSKVLVTINGNSHEIFCQSYLGLGQDDARKAMRVQLSDKASCCFPTGFSPEHDAGDILDGVGRYRLSLKGDYQFSLCNEGYENLISEAIAEKPLPDLGAVGIDFVGTDAIYHAAKYWEIEADPIQLTSMILANCSDLNAFPGIEINERVQAQAANATYVQALLYGKSGLFKSNRSALVRALPNLVDGQVRLTWTRGFLLQKYSQT